MTQQITPLEQTLSRYAMGPDLLTAALQGLEDIQLDLAVSSDSWSIRQLIHHIVDGDYLWKEFLLRAAGEDGQVFTLEWYWCLPQDEWVKRWSYAGRDISQSVALLIANRHHTLDLLRQLPHLWENCLLIPTRQGGQERVSVGQVVEMQARHVEAHVEDIRRIRSVYNV